MSAVKEYFEGPTNGFYRLRTKRELVLFIGRNIAKSNPAEDDVEKTVSGILANSTLFRKALRRRGIDPERVFFLIFINDIYRDRLNKLIISYYADERDGIKVAFPLDVAPKSDTNPWPAMIDLSAGRVEILPSYIPSNEKRLLQKVTNKIRYLTLLLDVVWPQETIELFVDLVEQMAAIYEEM